MGVIVMAAHFALWVFANASVRRFRGAQAYSARKDAADSAASGAKDAGASGRNGCFESASPPKRRLITAPQGSDVICSPQGACQACAVRKLGNAMRGSAVATAGPRIARRQRASALLTLHPGYEFA